MTGDIMTNKKFQAIIKELFIRCTKLNISLVFTTQSYFSVSKKVSKSLRFKKRSFNTLIKMIETDELKIFHDKIKANQTQYDLDREAAKISSLPSKEFEKYRYLTYEDLGYKAAVVK